MTLDAFMQNAIDLSAEALKTPGAAPFGAVVVRDGVVVGSGLNHAVAKFDPTSHGEVEAIRDACAKLKTLDLAGCDLYTSCEPCALCVATMRLVGIRKLYYAATLEGAGPIVGPLFKPAIDVADLRSECGQPVGARRLPDEQMGPDAAMAILSAWAAAETREAG